MEILVLESSGNKHGSSNILAEAFIRGAEENGHSVKIFDVYRANIRPCLGCNRCGMNGPCVLKDDYEGKLKKLIKEADMLVFVMPVYYYSWPAQLKVVVDRFYSFSNELTSMHKKTVLLSVALENSDEVFSVVRALYNKICEYMQFEDKGIVLGSGCGTPATTQKSAAVNAAYKLGKSV